ncbi:zinc finger protein 429-like [Anoplophora glabripennis]|uniref:zinc finger protein 429-like n=1 Tax=Anoplophora glabripennis TaxID=217634 RepID=UPI000C773C73|nr:zinc finger protein 429-like [Anoplophora glabripennis]
MYTCNICSKGFAYKSRLSRHANKHKSAASFPCDTCGKKFTRQDNLISHRKNRHNNSELTADDDTNSNDENNRKYIYRPLQSPNDDDEQSDCDEDDPDKLVNELRYYIEECRLTKEHWLCSGIINKLHNMGIIQ